ncbi:MULTISPECIES: hypothetical protein [Luteibacter]|uniref:hypothetical protein n=1 Tax=Luteibacter sp. dw_328 TaxID=2719796 RepID=UPI000AE27F64|nr:MULTISPECIES: hypothetical protein [Luteibacter]
MSRMISGLVFSSIVAGALLNGTAIASSHVDGLLPSTSASVAQASDTSDDAGLSESAQPVCDKFYNTINDKKKNEALKHKDATVAAIEQIEIILKDRDAAVVGKTMSVARPTLDEAESKIDAVVPEADRSWYALIHKYRYDYDHKYAPVCPTASR